MYTANSGMHYEPLLATIKGEIFRLCQGFKDNIKIALLETYIRTPNWKRFLWEGFWDVPAILFCNFLDCAEILSKIANVYGCYSWPFCKYGFD